MTSGNIEGSESAVPQKSGNNIEPKEGVDTREVSFTIDSSGESIALSDFTVMRNPLENNNPASFVVDTVVEYEMRKIAAINKLSMKDIYNLE